ncbi:unnamed protein product [Candidula unifasciata]|uniref:Glycolipid transfer protein domain-containing protein n=1 Tax=Candidula unifasciata TaxID=100452 RepID=A0A8S3YLK3_9EUPU|nr:unnamed protein product [Candidula unifasciata]
MSTFNSDRKSDFDLEIVLHAFQRCLREDRTLMLQEYVTAYHELCRFFKLTGPLFAFVARDLESKIKAVEYHLHADHGSEYKSLQSMVVFEVKHGTTHTKGSHPSGCRMFLRLHFALEFILSFMKRVMVGDENEKMSKLAWEVYVKTLYKHHPWLTRKLAAIAVYALPSKKHLIDVLCKQDYNRVLDLLAQVVDSGQPVYDVAEEVLAANSLLNIP